MKRLTAEEFLASNKAWAKDFAEEHKGFFKNSAKGPQEPKMLWIGCSDSRAPETLIMDALPGEVFVQRNIANQFPEKDVNSGSVLQYAVEHLGVGIVVVAGHSHCGGVGACYEAVYLGKELPGPPLQTWLGPLKQLATDPGVECLALEAERLRKEAMGKEGHEKKDLEKEASKTEEEARSKLTELNVMEQMKSVQEELEKMKEQPELAKKVLVYGWIYKLETGIIQQISPPPKCGH